MKQRLLSIDILRGLTIIMMIVVNSPGTWDYVAAPLRHSVWNGLTLADVIFPCFLFIMGITTYISLHKHHRACSWPLLGKILRRAAVLFALGLLINWTAAGLPDLHLLRVPGVLQRFAICYLVVALLALAVSVRRMCCIAVVLLAGYAVLLIAGNGYEYGEGSVLAAVDSTCLGSHMMCDGGIDPEGILSTIPSIAHTIIGYCMGAVLLARRRPIDTAVEVAQWAVLLLFAGLLADAALPMNKRLWSPSFVAVTCGLSSLALLLLMIIVDVKQRRLPVRMLLAFGINPLVCYMLGELLYIALNTVLVAGEPLQTYYYGVFVAVAGNNAWASFLAAVGVAAAVGGVAWMLYARKIIVKI